MMVPNMIIDFSDPKKEKIILETSPRMSWLICMKYYKKI